MKFLVLAAVLALANADAVVNYVKSDESQAPIVRSDSDSSPEGSFQYAFETGNGIVAQAEGVVLNPNSEAATLVIKGSYRYTAPDGTPVEITYEADENGYRPQGASIPVPPPVPEPILRSLEYIASQPQQVEYYKKTQA